MSDWVEKGCLCKSTLWPCPALGVGCWPALLPCLHSGVLFQLQDLRASYEELKAQSQEEIRRLWAQLELAGPGRQEPRGEAPLHL